MAAVWRLGEAKVEDVRREQPKSRHSAYTTVQTVMNRLVDRGLLVRERRGNAYVYKPSFAEADYLSRAIRERLESASPEARQAALMNLLGGLEPADLDALSRYANRIRRAREREDR